MYGVWHQASRLLPTIEFRSPKPEQTKKPKENHQHVVNYNEVCDIVFFGFEVTRNPKKQKKIINVP